MFARDYLPLWRIASGTVERLAPWLWIDGIASEHHFGRSLDTAVWSRGPAREMALKRLVQHRIFELPKLVDVMPHLLEDEVGSIGDGVWRLFEQRGADAVSPAYAKLNARISYG